MAQEIGARQFIELDGHDPVTVEIALNAPNGRRTLGKIVARVSGEDYRIEIAMATAANVDSKCDEGTVAIVGRIDGLSQREWLQNRPVWKTIQNGTYPSPSKLCSALTRNGYKIGEAEGNILTTVPLSQAPISVQLVRATVADLGFPRGGLLEEICKSVLSLGWQLCQPEDGPQLRLQYPEQPPGEWIFLAMEPIADENSNPTIFTITHYTGNKRLGGRIMRPESSLSSKAQLVFRH